MRPPCPVRRPGARSNTRAAMHTSSTASLSERSVTATLRLLGVSTYKQNAERGESSDVEIVPKPAQVIVENVKRRAAWPESGRHLSRATPQVRSFRAPYR